MANRVLEDNRYLTKEKALLRETGNQVLAEEQSWYNCGGFALGTYDWYLPYEDEWQWEEWVTDLCADYEGYDELCDALAARCVEYMQCDGVAREIGNEAELREDEYLVLFRAAETDFHYARRLSNGEWWHKMGGQDIEWISEDEACGDDWWRNRLSHEYGGRTRMLAVKQINFAAWRQARRSFAANRKVEFKAA